MIPVGAGPIRAAFVVLCLAGCGDGDAPAPPGPTGSLPTAPSPTSPDPGPDPEDGVRTVTVEMRGISFEAPGGGDIVTIGLGDRVRWVNLDGTLHTATSTSVPEGGKGFNSGQLPPGATYEFQPNVTGTWTYDCLQFPDRMARARINVVP